MTPSEPAVASGYCPRCGQYMPRTLDGSGRVHECDRTPPLDGLPPTIFACPVCGGHGLSRWGCWGTIERPHDHTFMRPIYELIREGSVTNQRRHGMTTEGQTEQQEVEIKVLGGTVPPPPPPPPTPMFVELGELGELDRDRWALGLQREYGGSDIVNVVVYDINGYVDRSEPVTTARDTVSRLGERDGGTDDDVEDDFGVWRRDGDSVSLLLPCGDTAYFSFRRLVAFVRALDRLTVSDPGTQIPDANERDRQAMP